MATNQSVPEKEHGETTSSAVSGDIVNISGHRQELNRIFDRFSAISLAVTTGSVWPPLAGSITVAIFNGGPPGLIYQFIAVSVLYWFVAASIAELASSIPSAGGVYHWATITAGRHGKLCGYFAGWWNFLAWLFGTASILQIGANTIVSMYSLTHQDFVEQRWMVFVVYIILTWFLAGVVLFANQVLPRLEQVGGFFIVVGWLVTMIVCAVLPFVNGQPYDSSAFVWKDWQNGTGYSSSGFVFLLGMLNGAYAVGTPDVISHLAEEIPRPQINLPYTILYQYVIGFFSGFLFLIPALYGIYDLPKVQSSASFFPLAEVYLQVTGSPSGAVGLLFLVLAPMPGAAMGCYLTSSRLFWTLARDRATPFHRVFSTISLRWKNPFSAILLDACLVTCLGCIYLGNATAFTAFVSSFVLLSMASYLAAILPHLLSGRSNIVPGPFWMSGAWGYAVNTISCLFMVAFIVIFSFPFAMPVTSAYMNYTCVIFGGFTLIFGSFYFFLKDYEGPNVVARDEAAEL